MPHEFLTPRRPGAAPEPPAPVPPRAPSLHAPPRPKLLLPKFPRWRWGRHIAAILALTVVAILGSGAIAAGSAYAGRAAVEEAQLALGAQDYRAFQARMAAAEAHFRRARFFAGPLQVLVPVPAVGEQVQAVAGLLEVAAESTGAVNAAFVLLHDLLAIESAAEGVRFDIPSAASLATLSADEKRALLARLADAAPRIRDIDRRVREALATLDAIPTARLAGPLAAEIVPLKARVAEMRDALLPIAPLAEALPAMAGYPTPKTYMFLMLNNTELRPGGGFIGSFGLIGLSNGEVTRFDSEDVYALDAPTFGKVGLRPPQPFVDYLDVDDWGMRDANWSPDFKTSSEQVIALYDRERAIARPDLPAVDGIIAITPEVAADLLRMVGPVTVDDVTFTADNLLDELQFQVHQAFLTKGIPEGERKGILVELVQEVFSRLQALPAASWPEGLKIAQKHLTEKRIMLYDRDPNLQQVFEHYLWAGRTIVTDGDYLRWVDANLAALKTDLVMERALTYGVRTQADGSLVATAAMTYRNTGSFTFRTTRYRTYARIFVPEGSRLIRVDGSLRNDRTKNPGLAPDVPETGVEEGKTWFGAFTAVEPGETRTLSFTYALPENVSRMVAGKAYSLVVQKQLGTGAFPLSVTVDLPDPLVYGNPSEEVADIGDSRYRLQTSLRVDRGFVARTR